MNREEARYAARRELGWAYMRTRRYDEAATQFQRTLDLDPNFRLSREQVAWVCVLKGKYAEALEQFKKTGERPDDPWLGYLYAKMGRRDDARRVADNLKCSATQRYVDPYIVAIPYAGLDDKAQAFVWLEKGYQQRSAFMSQLNVEAFFDSLRADPRFQDLVRRMNFPQ